MNRTLTALLQALIVALFLFVVLAGGTYNGLLTPLIQSVTLGFIAVVAVAWLVIRWRLRWRWHLTPLDAAILGWAAAIALAFITNLESGRRMLLGVWYVALYVAVWYALYDAIANGGMRRDMLVTALLIAGIAVMAVGYFQLRQWFAEALPLWLSGQFSLAGPRPTSTFGNPNFVGTLLVAVIPLAFSRAVAARRLVRAVWLVYVLLAGGLLLLTFTRGAWIASGVSFAVAAFLLLSRYGLLRPAGFRHWWSARGRAARVVSVASVLLVVAVGLAAVIFLIRTLSIPGRTLELRTYIWRDALVWFAERPLTGHGLFTFGRALLELESIPPRPTHSHAHNLPLQVAAELGIAGLLALALTVAQVARQMVRNWRGLVPERRLRYAGIVVAVVAVNVHQWFDVTVMAPAIALVGLVLVLLAVYPESGARSLSPSRARPQVMALTTLWIALLATGFWSNTLYSRYTSALGLASTTGNYAEAADQLQTLIEADPGNAVYYYQQGMLYGLLAEQGDTTALTHAIADFERYVGLEPHYSAAWANLGALYWQVGRRDDGLTAMLAAVDHAPGAWQLQRKVGEYYEVLSREAGARRHYTLALALRPDLVLLPGWGDTALQREESADSAPGDVAHALLLLHSGQFEDAQVMWQQSTARGQSTAAGVIDALFALYSGDHAAAASALDRAAQRAAFPEDDAWLRFGARQLETVDPRLAGPRWLVDTVLPGPLDRDFIYGPDLHQIQFLRLSLPRQFLPQVDYVTVPPVLLNLLESSPVTVTTESMDAAAADH